MKDVESRMSSSSRPSMSQLLAEKDELRSALRAALTALDGWRECQCGGPNCEHINAARAAVRRGQAALEAVKP